MGAAKEGDPIGIYRSTDKCKTFERVNDDMHQFGGPGNGNFVQGDMNTFGVVYMSTVGRGLIVGAPEGVDITTKIAEAQAATGSVLAGASMLLQGRSLSVTAPAGSNVALYSVNGEVKETFPVAGAASISLDQLPAGRYVAKMFDARGKVLASKFIVLR